MLKLMVTAFSDGKTVTMSLQGEGTVINTMIHENTAKHVADYIKWKHPHEVIFNNKTFEKQVMELMID